MTHDDQLPPIPKTSRKREFAPDADVMPALPSMDGSDINHQPGHWARFQEFASSNTQTTIALIFVGSFILGVLFTSGVLAGFIEIQPAAIKGFLKSILGKN